MGEDGSFFVVIPKQIIFAKGWEKGDKLQAKLNEKGDIVIRKLNDSV